jgi:GPH family glycoside/pentoside/hexuronide:cation symporter
VFNSGINVTGYVPPAADGTWIAQNAATQNYFVLCVSLIPAICLAFVAIMAYLFKVEPMMPKITADITSRHRAEAEARGEVYISSEEKAALELAEQERIAEEKRVEELRAKCAKKGLDFVQEEAKYQAKLTAKKAKSAKKTK